MIIFEITNIAIYFSYNAFNLCSKNYCMTTQLKKS